MIALDTNLLIYAHRARNPFHRQARSAIAQACQNPSGCGIASASVSEFLSVVTHPRSQDKPSTISEATAFLRGLGEDGGVRVWVPGEGFPQRFLQAVQDLAVTGVRIFDLQIALTVLENGAVEIWTHDRDFISLPGLKKRDPFSN